MFVQSSEVSVYVEASQHANLDSFPLRYGFSFDENTVLTLWNCRNFHQQDNGRYKFEGEFSDPHGNHCEGIFVGIDDNKKFLKLATVIRSEVQTENELSAKIRSLRMSGAITVERLKEIHPYYLEGKANTVVGLIETLTSLIKKEEKKRADEEIQTVKKDFEKEQADKEADREADLDKLAEKVTARISENKSKIKLSEQQSSIEHSQSRADARKLEPITRIDQSIIKNKITKIFGPPGTGKTTRLVQIVKDQISGGISPRDIGFFAFTNFATNIAKERIIEEFPNYDIASDFGGFRTLHSLAYQSLPSKVSLLDLDQAKAFDPEFVVTEVMMREDDPESSVSRATQVVADAASTARSQLIPFSEYLKLCDESDSYRLNKWLGYPAKVCERLLNDHDIELLLNYEKKYEAYKKEIGVIDYTSILEIGCGQTTSIPNYEILIIDEVQDLSNLQWAFAEKLFHHANKIFLAGDDDQAICQGFGASPETFVGYAASQEVFLEQSYRVPTSVHTHLFKDNGIVAELNKVFQRQNKNWKPRSMPSGKLSEGLRTDISGKDLIQLVESFPRKDWLIMAATHMTLEKVSAALNFRKIPHILSNRVVSNTDPDHLPSIKLNTVWGAKGGEAEITALLRGPYVDEKMYESDPRLLYVASTRTKSVHLDVGKSSHSDLDLLKSFIAVHDDQNRTRSMGQSDISLEFSAIGGDIPQGINSKFNVTEKQEPVSNDSDLGHTKVELKKMLNQINRLQNLASSFEIYAAVLNDVIWVKRGKHVGIALVMSDNSERAKIFGDLPKDYAMAKLLIGQKIITIPSNPSKNHPKEWFNEIHLLDI